jgi:ubiquinone/menaquinone biosynthesis C-methylase UbiE
VFKYKRKNDVGIYGLTAKWYDKNSRESRLAEMQGYANEVSKQVKGKGNILEIAPGPGYLSIELAKKGHKVTGVELSPDFVKIEQVNAREAKVSVDFKEGNVSNIPSSDNEFDFTICTAAFKNFKNPVKALNEMYRVLKPGGTSLIVDMNHDASKEDLKFEIEKMNMKGFDKLFMKFAFNTFLTQSAYTKEEIENFIKQTPFKNYEVKKGGISFYIYLNK